MKRLKYPTEALQKMWKTNFIRETAKFAKSTYLCPEDFMTEFKDKDDESWRILGVIEGKDMPCEKISTGEVFIWDRWKVSLLVHPEKHKNVERKTETFYPSKKKTSKKKVEEIINDSESE